jgi:hypothetical protein
MVCCGGAEESKGGGGDAAATVAHTVKGGIGVEEQDADAAAALPHAVAPVGAPSVYLCGGAEERKGCNGDAAATFANAVVPVRAPSAYRKSCCCAEQRHFCKDEVTRRDWAARRVTFDTGVPQRNRDSGSTSPELSFKTEGLSTRTLSSFTRESSKWNRGYRKVNSPCS